MLNGLILVSITRSYLDSVGLEPADCEVVMVRCVDLVGTQSTKIICVFIVAAASQWDVHEAVAGS